MNRSFVFLLFCFALLGYPLSGRGQESVEEKAKAAFDKGKKLFENADYKGSADAFREAYLLKPSWKLLYNIGQAEAAAKRYGLALEAFEKYLAEAGDELSNERRKSVIDEVEQFRAMVGSIEVIAPDGAAVFVDGVNRGETPLPGTLKVAAGVEHEVKIELEQVSEKPRTVIVSGGEMARVEFGREQAEQAKPAVGQDAAAEPAGTPADGGSSKLKVAGWIGVGLGGAMLLGGGATGIATMSLNAELEDECVDGQCLPDSHDKLDKRNALAIASDVLIWGGAAVAAAGVTMLLGGGATGIATMSLNTDLEDECIDGQCLPDSHDKLDKRNALAIASDVLIWGGAAVAAAGVTMLIIDAVSGEKKDERAAIVPTFGERHAGLAFMGRF